MKPKYHMTDCGCNRLVSAMITSAAEDVAALQSAGVLDEFGEIVPEAGERFTREGRRSTHKVCEYTNVPDVKNLVDFFRIGGGIDTLISASGMAFNPSAARRKLFPKGFAKC